MARVVAQLVDVGRDALGEAIALLQVDHEVGGGLAPDLAQRLGVPRAVDGDADEVAAGSSPGGAGSEPAAAPRSD